MTRDGFAIKHVCATPEKAIEITAEAGYSYLLGGGSDPAAADPGFLTRQLLAGKEFYLSNTREWSGDLVLISRYGVV